MTTQTEQTETTSQFTVVYPTWHLYKQVNGFNVYDSSVEAETQPANSSQWKPPTTDTGSYYFDGFCWVLGPAIGTVTFAHLQELAQEQSDVLFSNAVNLLTSGYTAEEQASWTQQVQAATVVVDGGEASALLTTLAEAQSVTVAVLAAKIIAKSAAYNTAYTTLLSAYQAERAKITSAKVPTDLPPFIRTPIPRAGGQS